jgi:serpin B
MARLDHYLVLCAMAFVLMWVPACDMERGEQKGSSPESKESAAEAERPAAEGEKPVTEMTGAGDLTSSNLSFAIDLYKMLSGNDGNIALSPYSISSALAMTYAGARGNTASQMADVLNLPVNDPNIHARFGALTGALNSRGRGKGIDLSVANALWGQEGEDFLMGFLEITESVYGAGLKTVDFASDPERARGIINVWVRKETRQKIEELLKRGALDRSTSLVLTNAIYFKGGWTNKFDPGLTREGDFWIAPGSSVPVDMMHQKRKLKYFQTDEVQVLDLPYQGDEFSMIVLLPKALDGLGALERDLTAGTLDSWLSRMRVEDVSVSLPKFKLTSDLLLNEPLQAMGMTDAFSLGKADFSGMTGEKNLFIDAVVHQAIVEVDEEGTEAAAATAVVMKKGPAIPEFKADHPFMLLIRDNISGSLLFMGRVTKPV